MGLDYVAVLLCFAWRCCCVGGCRSVVIISRSFLVTVMAVGYRFPAPLMIFAFRWRSFWMASLSLPLCFWACFQWRERDLSLGSLWPEVKWVLFYAWVWYSFSSSSVSLDDLSDDVVAGV